ncbi:hypothetical protein [Rhodococcoides kyotonense]|uniref:Uncharacterized protein n=1 Tax=Rhodococcoides kyotonense TaxID=398843 RepID=A0A239HVW9_9NOCA|nr:hypothetical protein [Rhodococcus kyotonensis]SNS85218.1 hypothetical protein SAMN05421642_10661 [Rhodococcus kyotonensis]
MSADTDSMELVELEESELYEEDSDAIARRRRILARVVAVGAAVAGLIVLLAVLPLAGIDYPHSRAVVPSLVSPSDAVLTAFGITPVLVAVAALTVVALMRKLPYGIGAVITLVIGASLTTAGVRAWANGWVPASALPNGYVTAAVALVCATTLVASSRFLPMVWGLGGVGAATVCAAAVIGGATSVVGVLTTVLIVLGWWAASSAVMVYSPVAAEREKQNPFDTAALAFRRMR